jgi:hypothetical protein
MNLDAKALATTLAEAIKPALQKRDDRIAELERRLADLEKATTGEPVAEWPIPERNAA